MNTASTFTPQTAAWSTSAPPAPAWRATWTMRAYSVARRPGKVNPGSPVRPRRVCVYAPDADSALLGCGAGRDELCHPVTVRPWERITGLGWPEREEIADFYDTVGNALITGGGMALALSTASRIARTARMRGIVGVLHLRVVHGAELHVAMRSFPRVFTPMQLAMVEAAAATGLDKAGGLLMTLAERLQREGKVWRRFIGALAYPFSLLALTAVGAVVLEIWALPPMVDLFHTLGGRLPPLTRRFYAVAQFMRSQAMILGPAAVMMAVAVVAWGPRLMRTQACQRISVRLWLVGPIVQSLALVRALGTFILLKQAGARVRDQFGMAAAAAGNCVVGKFFTACYERIALGESVEESFTAERHRLGEDGVRIAGKMEVGMAGADLSVLINRIIDELNDRAETRLALLPNAIRWPLLILCCAMIGLVALAIVLPYPSLIADVAQQQAQSAAGK